MAAPPFLSGRGTMSDFRIYAVYEAFSVEKPFGDFPVLGPGMSDAEYEAFLWALHNYVPKAPRLDDLESICAFLAHQTERRVLAGGVLIRAGDFEFVPGCCSGLESWRQLFGLKQGDPAGWFGHDPDPWVDTRGEVAVFHSDDREGDSYAVAYDVVEAAMVRLQADLIEFLDGLRALLTCRLPDLADNIVGKVDRWLEISNASPPSNEGEIAWVSRRKY